MAKSLSMLLLFCSILVAGCRDVPCLQAAVFVGFIAFQDQELDSVVIRSYVKGSQFADLRDSLVFTRANHHFVRRGDTVLLVESRGEITSNYDYLLDLPNAGKAYRLSEIFEPRTDGGRSKAACINPIRSFRINDQLVNGKDWYNFIYLNK